MTYSNNYTQPTNNSQASNNDDNYWEAPRRVRLVRFTKVKTGRDGSPQRGALIQDEQGQERWVTESPMNEVFKLNWNSWCFFNGVNARPSLTVSQPQQNNNNMNQPTADYYSRMADYQQPNNYNEQSYSPSNGQQYAINELSRIEQNNDYSGQPHVTDNTTINDRAIEKACITMSNIHNLLSSTLPNVDAEEITKMAISIYIQQTKSNVPF